MTEVGIKTKRSAMLLEMSFEYSEEIRKAESKRDFEKVSYLLELKNSIDNLLEDLEKR